MSIVVTSPEVSLFFSQNCSRLPRSSGLAIKASGKTDPREWFVFFDEIRYLKGWEVHLKVLVDRYPHTKFIVSGSAAAALRLKSSESGAVEALLRAYFRILALYENVSVVNHCESTSPSRHCIVPVPGFIGDSCSARL